MLHNAKIPNNRGNVIPNAHGKVNTTLHNVNILQNKV